MNEVRRQAYLEAMGFDVWLLRPARPEPDRLVVGPGEDSTLLVCASAELSAGKLAGDIARAIGGSPVWAWSDSGADGGVRLPEAVEQGLFTRVIVFGHALGWQLFGGDAPDVLGSSSIRVTSSLDELAVRGSARRELWGLLRDSSFPT